MMEDGIYEELEKVFAKISKYGKKGEVVPIAELFFCYTVSRETVNLWIDF